LLQAELLNSPELADGRSFCFGCNSPRCGFRWFESRQPLDRYPIRLATSTPALPSTIGRMKVALKLVRLPGTWKTVDVTVSASAQSHITTKARTARSRQRRGNPHRCISPFRALRALRAFVVQCFPSRPAGSRPAVSSTWARGPEIRHMRLPWLQPQGDNDWNRQPTQIK